MGTRPRIHGAKKEIGDQWHRYLGCLGQGAPIDLYARKWERVSDLLSEKLSLDIRTLLFSGELSPEEAIKQIDMAIRESGFIEFADETAEAIEQGESVREKLQILLALLQEWAFSLQAPARVDSVFRKASGLSEDAGPAFLFEDEDEGHFQAGELHELASLGENLAGLLAGMVKEL